MEYHIFESNGGDYHLAVMENGKCILWFTADLQTVTTTMDDLAAGNCDLWDVDGREDNPQNCWDTMQNLLNNSSECKELDI